MRLRIAFALLALVMPARADPVLDALVAAYPDHLSGYDNDTLVWKNGRRMPVSDGVADKSFERLLDRPSIRDQFALSYPVGAALRPPGRNEDPGRFRNEAFFTAMYGDCGKGEVTAQLRRVAWLPRHGGGSVLVTERNGVADKVAAISRELDALPPLAKYAAASAGAYSCRSIAGTRRRSFHAYGAAIDLNLRFSDYWLWKAKTQTPVWRNRIPAAIVEIFERHGFIWGGKWYHYDTMHFEYRPELIALAKMR
jgi:hypothetical protein